MTTEQSIFEQATPVVTPPVVSVLPPEVSEFVGIGKKYQSVEDAIKSVPHAQKHIQTLEQELAQVKEELTKRRTTEELLTELKSNGITHTELTNSNKENDPEQVSKLIATAVKQELAQEKAHLVAQSNTQKVTEAFVVKFGNKAEEVFNTIAQESGLTVANLNYLAATSPSAVLKLAGFTSKQDTPVSKINSSVRTDANVNINTEGLSAKVKAGASTKDLVNAWKIAGQKVGRTY